jgi:hypothetical protein
VVESSTLIGKRDRSIAVHVIVTTRANVEERFRTIPGAVWASATSNAPGNVSIALDWIGRDLETAKRAAREAARDAVAAGMNWTVEIRAWRWAWLRRVTRWLEWAHWPERRAAVSIEDVVRGVPSVRVVRRDHPRGT